MKALKVVVLLVLSLAFMGCFESIVLLRDRSCRSVRGPHEQSQRG